MASAQQRQVSGTVTGADGNPIVGASVFVEGTSTGTTTNVAGDFALTAPANGTLTVSFIGYQTKSVAIAGKTNLKIVLDE
ncbi:MAG: carboxypeptidase-like regulatory domain-containing protein, partial [Alistipes sp.]|nr:carboxypeptidase-like regulatory domain-containing protein [Alistipes sp.]